MYESRVMANTPPGATDTKRARPEAGPLARESLSPEQQRAAAQADGLVREIAESRGGTAPEDPSLAFLPRLDERRGSQVILIDGERGMGKTTVLLSLLRQWTDEYRKNPGGAQIVPLRALDLRPRPNDTVFWLQFVSSFRPLIDAMRKVSAPENMSLARQRSWEPEHGTESQALRAWRRFHRAVAVGWEYNQDGRSRVLDPDAFAIELEEAEQQRGDLTTAFRRFIDAVVEEYMKWRGNPLPPLFVFPVDDADMDAEKAREALDIVRTMYHPRLVFLLTGHSELFLSDLSVSVERELPVTLRDVGAWAQLGVALLSRLTAAPKDGNVDLSSAVQNIAKRTTRQRLAEDIYDKDIPASHRCRIEPLSPESRRTLTTERLGISVPEELRKLVLNVGQPAPHTVADLLEDDVELARCLPSNMRRLVDMVLQIRNSIAEWDSGSSDGPRMMPASRWIENLWEQHEGWLIAQGLQHYLQIDEKSGALALGSGERFWATAYRTQLGLHLPTDGARVLELSRLVELVPYPDQWTEAHANALRGTEMDEISALARLTQRVFRRQGEMAGRVQGDHFNAQWTGRTGVVRGRLRFRDNEFTSVWPLPMGWTFIDVERFAAEWNELLSTTPQPLADGLIARRFLQLAIEVSRRDNPAAGWTLEQLAHELIDCMDSQGTSQRETALRTWAENRALLLCTREYGLNSSTAETILRALRDRVTPARFRRILDRTEDARAKEIVALASGVTDDTAKAFLKLLDDADRTHPWVRERERVVTASEASHSPLDEFANAAKRVLGGYPLNPIVRALVGAPDEHVRRFTKLVEGAPEVEGAHAIFVQRIWREASELVGESQLQGLVSQQADQSLLVEPPEVSPHDLPPKDYDLTSDLGLVLCISGHVDETTNTPGETLPSYLKPLWMACWDVYARDQSWYERPWPPRGFHSAWSGVWIEFEGQKLPSWPNHPWARFDEAKESLSAWPVIVADVQKLANQSLSGEHLLTALAESFLGNICGRSRPYKLRLPTTNDFISRAFEQSSNSNNKWSEQRVLFAAPESGLPKKLAEAIIAWSRKRAQSKVSTAELQQLRIERAVEFGVKDAPSVLERLDAKARELGHPWPGALDEK